MNWENSKNVWVWTLRPKDKIKVSWENVFHIYVYFENQYNPLSLTVRNVGSIIVIVTSVLVGWLKTFLKKRVYNVKFFYKFIIYTPREK